MERRRQTIADYALLGDCQTAALVGRDGSIDWWCPPRFDSSSVFARLLGESAGHWSIAPTDAYEVEREYVPETMVLRTTFRTAGGTLRLTDALAFSSEDRDHSIGLHSPHAIARVLELLAGEVSVEVELSPRPEYGALTPELERTPLGVMAPHASGSLLLTGDQPFEISGGTATARFHMSGEETAAFALHHREESSTQAEAPLDPRESIEDTIAGWRSWSGEHEAYEGAYRQEVLRGALVLQALTYQPSGAIVAAPTTSLPEIVGGDWNWDYRFAWLRDASLTLQALWVAACPSEAARHFEWMARAVGGAEEDHVQIVFGVEGERDLSERRLDHLEGYRASRPVRVGNEAWKQKQLDIYGEVLDAAYVLRERLGEIEPEVASFLCGLADRAARSWREPDAGIWEGREGERDYLSSKLMCWVALDRAVKLAGSLGHGADEQLWSSERDQVRRAILERGWSEKAGAYTGAFGSDHLDASVLLMPLMDFLPAAEKRMARTIEAIERDLCEGALVRRWTGAEDGAFVICSCWLADCHARAGRLERAREILDEVIRHSNDVGLLSEEIDFADGALIGNFPQGFAHVGLINAAWSIEQAEQRRRTSERKASNGQAE